MQATEAAKKTLKEREGLRLEAYQDQKGVWTIGWGHTPATKGMRITETQAEALFASDVKAMEDAINRSVRVKISQEMFDALLIFVFNIGAAAFSTSTMLKKINAGNFEGAAAEFPKWNKITMPDGKKIVSDGQVKRRAIEESIFRSGIEAVKKAAPGITVAVIALVALYFAYKMLQPAAAYAMR